MYSNCKKNKFKYIIVLEDDLINDKNDEVNFDTTFFNHSKLSKY